jgi:nucleotide-binding universal stress UspA family protein
MGMVVVGVDGSKGAQRALEWALSEARLRGADLRVVHAHRVPVLPTYVQGRAGGYAGPSPEQLRAAAKQVIEEALGAAGDTAGVSVERVPVVGGQAATTLIDASLGADLLVVGSRGLGGFTGLLLGSVSQQCVAHAHCPVVVVPDDR